MHLIGIKGEIRQLSKDTFKAYPTNATGKGPVSFKFKDLDKWIKEFEINSTADGGIAFSEFPTGKK